MYVDASNFASATRMYLNTPARYLTTSATDPGWTLSTTRDSFVTYSTTTTTTASIGGVSNGWVLLEMAPPTWSLASDWIEKARSGNAQTVTLAVALQSVQSIATPMKVLVPAGYAVRLRTISTGTGSNAPTYSLNSQQEVLL